MAFAAVFFALPIAVASAVTLWALNGLGISEAALVYVLAGLGGMTTLIVSAASTAKSRP